ncbi:lysozyme [Burkholderia alba]|uniref:lysozyme n=1 Tax=Burkholderia alba TaxID=2683677 RepID=UPI002B060C2D|nr:lysozyme [Burkholderia alba]
MPDHPERTGTQGIDLIKQFEGLRLTRYLDAVGKPTIGYGHLILPHERFDRPISASQAEALLRQDLRSAEQAVRQLVRVAITQQQFDALISFAFNLGAGRLRSSTLARYLNAGAAARAADQFLVWNKAGGKPLAGLTRRRQAERQLFLS